MDDDVSDVNHVVDVDDVQISVDYFLLASRPVFVLRFLFTLLLLEMLLVIFLLLV